MWHHFNYDAAAEMRKKYIPIEKVLQIVNPSGGDTIMDIGGGDGHYSVVFSQHCDKVIYVDPSSPAVDLMRKRTEASQGKIEIYHDDICHMALPRGFNKVFFSNSFHDIHCRDELISRLADNGNDVKFALIEFMKDADIGPPDFVKIGPDELDSIFSKHGYSMEKREILEKHYISLYSRKSPVRN